MQLGKCFFGCSVILACACNMLGRRCKSGWARAIERLTNWEGATTEPWKAAERLALHVDRPPSFSSPA